MSFPQPGRVLAALLLLVALVGLSAAPSLAAVNMIAVRVDAQPGGGAAISIQFAGASPTYRALGFGTTEASVIFDGATVGPGVAPSIAGIPPLLSVTVLQTGPAVSVSLHLNQAGVQVRIRRGGPSTIFVDVVQPNYENRAAFTPPQPAGPPAGTITEVVPLKYADISEVAGLLVSGANVASNDTFNPQPASLGASNLGGTFGGNPVACAAALASIATIESDGLIERARQIERLAIERLSRLQADDDRLGDVRGRGAMIAVELVKSGSTDPD